MDALVQIVGPTDNWVLERLARKLAAKIPYSEFVPWKPRPTGSAQIVYYMNYALLAGPSGLVDIAFFTHLDESQQFLERAGQVDCCVCMAKIYADWLTAQGVENVAHIPMGFDYYQYRPRLVLGVIGRLDHPRKGKHLVEAIGRLPFLEIVVTDGRVPEAQLRDVYQRIDYVLIPATVEGGPLCLLEGLAMGKPVIAPETVGMVPEFPENPAILRYPAGDIEALTRLVTACHEAKSKSNELVRERTWDRWAQDHHELFVRLCRARSISIPAPSERFRFGMMAELEIPKEADLDALEAVVDQAAQHLYFGKDSLARSVLEEALSRFPCLERLLPTGHRDRKPETRHARALR